MDRLEAMTLLLDTVDAGSFSAAARRRCVPVATLTRKVGQLETHLGATLLRRSTRQLVLTDAGERYVEGARRILAQVEEIEREASGEFTEPVGRLVVSAPRMFGRLHVLPIVNAFLQQHPGVSVDLQLTDRNVDLTSGVADVAVRIGKLPDSSLMATRVGNMRSVVAISPMLLDRSGKPRDLDDLAALPAIYLDIPLPQTLRERSKSHARLTVSGAEAAVDAAEAGIGYAQLLHYQVDRAVRAGRLTIVLEEFENEPSPVHLLHAPLMQLPQKTRRFLDFAQDRLRASLLDLRQECDRGSGWRP